MADAVDTVKHDHRKVEELFARYQKGDSTVIKEVCNELKVHTSIEEQVLYPALSEVPDGERLRREAQKEHGEVEQAIDRLERVSSDPSAVESLMSTIIDGVTHHVQEEEKELLPKMRDALGAERMTALGDQLLSAKRQKLVDLGMLVDLTKEELYQLAQGAQIEGRSDMSKDELIHALQR